MARKMDFQESKGGVLDSFEISFKTEHFSLSFVVTGLVIKAKLENSSVPMEKNFYCLPIYCPISKTIKPLRRYYGILNPY